MNLTKTSTCLGVGNASFIPDDQNTSQDQFHVDNFCVHCTPSSPKNIVVETIENEKPGRYIIHQDEKSVGQNETKIKGPKPEFQWKSCTSYKSSHPFQLTLPLNENSDRINFNDMTPTMQHRHSHPDLAIMLRTFQTKQLELNGKNNGQQQVSSDPISCSSKFKNKFTCGICWSSCTDTETLTNWKFNILRQFRKYFLVYPCILFAIWALFYILFGEDQAFLGGGLFSLFVLEIFAIILGELMERIYLPPLLGMLAAGLILRNVPVMASVAKDLPSNLSTPLRAMSVVILLTRGAFSVNPTAIYNFRRVVPHLAVISCIAEALAGGIAVYLIIQFPLPWSALMGCIMSAMSGVAVMPFLVGLDSKNKDSNNTRSIAIAKTACGLDAILAICLAEFCFGFIFADGDLIGGLTKGVAEVLMGGAFGLFWGSLTGTLLDSENCIEIRTFAVFAGGCLSLLGLTTIGYPRGGPLGVFSGSLVTAILWRHKEIDGKNNDKINENFTKLWFLFQPLLFGIIGSRTDLSTVDWAILNKAIICMAISLMVRLVTAVVMCSWADMTWRQKIFIAISWIPKGTVQAALGPVALETAIQIGFGSQTEKLGYQIMNIAVLSIILASSFGSIALLLLGPRLLKSN